MTPEEQTLYRKASVGLALVTVLFAGFAWMTAQVEGFNVTVLALAITSALSGIAALWLTFRWRVATVLVVTMAILAGGAIGAVTLNDDDAADAHTIQCGAAPSTRASQAEKAIYRYCMMKRAEHALWHARNDVGNAVARNVRSGTIHSWCQPSLDAPGAVVLWPICGK